jgi:phospholipase/lecithinase/hemolysin
MSVTIRLAGCLLLVALQSCRPTTSSPQDVIVTGTGPARLVVFGDSLSDTGNFKQLNPVDWLLQFSHYDDGRITSGASSRPPSKQFQQGVWHEVLMAPPLGIPSLQGTENYAFAGATTGPGTYFYSSNGVQTGALILNLGDQIDRFLAANGDAASSDNLYVVWAGGNDIINVAEPGRQSVDAKPQAIRSTSLEAFANARNAVHRLAAAGATRMIWGNLPPLHSTIWASQFAHSPDCSQALQDAVQSFDQGMDDAIASLESEFQGQGLKIYKLDAYRLFAGVIADAYLSGGATYGITSFWAEASQLDPDSPDVDRYFFWDAVHPTSHVHAITANAVYHLLFPQGTP